MIFLHSFQTNNEFINAYEGEEYIEPWVSYTAENKKVNYNKSIYDMPLTFKFKESGVLHVVLPEPGPM